MASNDPPRLILLTGKPGIGKTTLVKKACSVLKESDIPIQGFYTEEIRAGGQRIGFDVVTLCGNRAPLARIESEDRGGGSEHQYKVGCYIVTLQSFEQAALPVLRISKIGQAAVPVIVIDEAGKMEHFSRPFVRAVRALLCNEQATILATIPVPKGKLLSLTEELRHHESAHIFEVTKDNRDEILPDIVSAIKLSRGTKSQ